MEPNPLNKVQVVDGHVLVAQNGVTKSYPLEQLPPRFIEWQLAERQRTYERIARGDTVAFHSTHLPVVATTNGTGIPNLANKGVGFTPKDEYLEYYLARLEDAVAQIASRPLAETRAQRVAVARELYSCPEHIDWRRLGLLEIFEGTTFRNLCAHPFASVLFTGLAPTFLSFQLDCAVEIITPEHPRYRFSWAMRRLFEYEPFHIVQTMFPYSYTFWIIAVHDKTPRTREER